MSNWKAAKAEGLEAAVAEFKAALPGWWFSVSECQVSCDASCAPTVESPHIELIVIDRRFDSGFHADLAQPSTMADALRDVLEQAQEAVRWATPSEPAPNVRGDDRATLRLKSERESGGA